MDETNPPTPEPPDAERPPGPAEPSEPPPPPELEEFLPATTSSAPESTGASRLEHWLAFLHNRLILAGLGIVVVLLLIAIVLIVIGQGETGPRRHVAPDIRTPESTSAPRPLGGLTGRVRATVTVRNGPDSTYAILGTIPKGATVTVVGRNTDESWLQIRYPPGSQLRGWVNARSIQAAGDLSRLAVAGPGPAPSIPVPTSAGPLEEPTPTLAEEPTATRTPRPTRTPPARPTPTRTPRPTGTSVPTATPQPTATPPVLPTVTPTG